VGPLTALALLQRREAPSAAQQRRARRSLQTRWAAGAAEGARRRRRRLSLQAFARRPAAATACQTHARPHRCRPPRNSGASLPRPARSSAGLLRQASRRRCCGRCCFQHRHCRGAQPQRAAARAIEEGPQTAGCRRPRTVALWWARPAAASRAGSACCYDGAAAC
jgi:hypothetical protein